VSGNDSLQRCEFKLLVSIVNHGVARKVVKASKEAGAEGGTTVLGEGTGSPEITNIFGIPVEPEKEIVLTLLSAEKVDSVLRAVTAAAKLDKPGHGIAFVLDVNRVAGICHRLPAAAPPGGYLPKGGDSSGGSGMTNDESVQYDLIITIVNKGDSEKVVEASRAAGAHGGTILFGRGTGIHEHARILGIAIEPEKEIVLTLISRPKSEKVLEAIVNATQLNKPGKGIAFVLEVERVAGINRPLNKMVNERLSEIL